MTAGSGLGPAGVRGRRRRLRAPRRRHRGVHRDLEARLDGAVARLARPLLRDRRTCRSSRSRCRSRIRRSCSAPSPRSGARRAARTCDGLYPMFLDAYADPGRFDQLREVVAREGERVGRDLSGFRLYAFASGRSHADRSRGRQAHAHRQRASRCSADLRALRGARLLARDHAFRRAFRDDRRALRDPWSGSRRRCCRRRRGSRRRRGVKPAVLRVRGPRARATRPSRRSPRPAARRRCSPAGRASCRS